MTEQPEFLGTFGRNVVCIKCHGKLANPDAPTYDDLNNAIFTCSSCGGMYREILDITTPNKPEKVSFQKPKVANEKESFADAKQAIAEQGIEYPNYNEFCPIINDRTGQREPFKPAKVAIWLHENDNFKTDKKSGILYFGDVKTGKWTSEGETQLKIIVTKILGDNDKEAHFKNILHTLRNLSYTNIEFSKKIACENCLLDLETQTPSPFNLDEMAFHEIPVKYDPDAQCPNWEAFIKTVVYPDDLALIQEWSGFLLLPDYRFHKILWIVGTGRNGKGVWQRTMETILGEQNVSSIGLEEFDGKHRFALKQLYGKLFNPCSEPFITKYGLQTPILKKATGQDSIEAEIKGKQARLTFRNYAKITVLANKFPKVNDQTTAFKERRLFVKFPFEFTGKNQIQNIEANWLTINDERSGILNWMLTGLKRLLEQGYFTESKTQQETEAEFLRASDTIGAFLTELGIFDKNLVTTRSKAFEAYKNYCDVLGLEAENEKKFTARLKETPRISVTSVKKPKQERAWKGVSFKEITDEGTIKTNTEDTRDTAKGGLYTQQYFETSENNKEYKIPVSSVSAVSNPEKKSESAAISEIAVNAAFSKTLYYEKIPRNPRFRCSAADSGGYECTFEAEYDLNSNLYCEAHFKEQVKTCEDNGFPVRPKVKEGA